MKLGTIYKQPGEKRRWSVDYTKALDVGDAVESVAVAVTPDGLTVSAFEVTPKVRVVCEGGTTGTTYKITLTMTTTGGNEVFEDELTVKVKEI